MNVILCGFGLAAPKVLEYLTTHKDVYQLAVFTHLDQPHARGLGQAAQALDLWWTVESINTAHLPFKPDMIISIYYRNIIKQHIIDACGGRIFNAHPSLLPRHRGCSSVPWAIIEGDPLTGITFHYIDAGIDTGPIILQAATQITTATTQGGLQKRLAGMVVDYFPAAFALAASGFAGVEQYGEANYNPRRCPYDGQIDPDWPQAKIARFIRAMDYPPLPPARLGEREIRSMDDYRKAIYDRHRETQSHHRLTVSR